MEYIRVLIADRHPVILQGLHSLIVAEKNFKIVASCGSARECIEAIRTSRPHIALVDMFFQDATNNAILTSANRFRTRVVFLAEIAELSEQILAIARGAYGVLMKDAAPSALLHCLQQVAAGQKLLPFTKQQNRYEAKQNFEQAGADSPMSHLTSREHEIVHLVCEGLSNKAIARRLNISAGTIKVHLHHIFQKLGTRNRSTLVALVLSGIDPPGRSRRRPTGA